jgi:hypothetical protein
MNVIKTDIKNWIKTSLFESHLIFRNLIPTNGRNPNRVLKPLVPNKYRHLSLVLLLPPPLTKMPLKAEAGMDGRLLIRAKTRPAPISPPQ